MFDLTMSNFRCLASRFEKIHLVEASINDRTPLGRHIAEHDKQSELRRRLFDTISAIRIVSRHLCDELKRLSQSSAYGTPNSLQFINGLSVPCALKLDFQLATKYTAVNSAESFAILEKEARKLEEKIAYLIGCEYNRIEIEKRHLKDGYSSDERDKGVKKLSTIQANLQSAYDTIGCGTIKVDLSQAPLRILKQIYEKLPSQPSPTTTASTTDTPSASAANNINAAAPISSMSPPPPPEDTLGKRTSTGNRVPASPSLLHPPASAPPPAASPPTLESTPEMRSTRRKHEPLGLVETRITRRTQGSPSNTPTRRGGRRVKPLTVPTPRAPMTRSERPTATMPPQTPKGGTPLASAAMERSVRLVLAPKPTGQFDLDDGVVVPSDDSVIWTGLVIESLSFTDLQNSVRAKISKLLNTGESTVHLSIVAMELSIDEFVTLCVPGSMLPEHKSMLLEDDSDLSNWLKLTESLISVGHVVIVVYCDWNGMDPENFGAEHYGG